MHGSGDNAVYSIHPRAFRAQLGTRSIGGVADAQWDVQRRPEQHPPHSVPLPTAGGRAGASRPCHIGIERQAARGSPGGEPP